MQFWIFTDHKSLEYIMTQRNLSLPKTMVRNTQWFWLLNWNILGTSNILADALLRIYSSDPLALYKPLVSLSQMTVPMVSLLWSHRSWTHSSSNPHGPACHCGVHFAEQPSMYPLHAMVSDLDTTGWVANNRPLTSSVGPRSPDQEGGTSTEVPESPHL